jgi:hypothetical protein
MDHKRCQPPVTNTLWCNKYSPQRQIINKIVETEKRTKVKLDKTYNTWETRTHWTKTTRVTFDISATINEVENLFESNSRKVIRGKWYVVEVGRSGGS